MIKSKKSLASVAAASVAALALLGAAPPASAAPTASISNIESSDIGSFGDGSFKKGADTKPSRTTIDVEGYGKVEGGGSLSIDAKGNAHKASGDATLRFPDGRKISGKVNCLDEAGKGQVVATGTYKLRGDKKNVGVFLAIVDDNGTPKKWGKKGGEPDRINAFDLGTTSKDDPDLKGLCVVDGEIDESFLAPVVKGDFDVDVHNKHHHHRR